MEWTSAESAFKAKLQRAAVDLLERWTLKQISETGKRSIMQTLSEKEIVNLIKQHEPFSAVIKNGAFSIKIDRYIPAICTAVHSGTAFSEKFAGKVQVDELVRRQEEAPYTGDLLHSLPIVVRGLESRFQYDLNSSPQECIPLEIQQKKIWEGALSTREISQNIDKHNSYFRVLHVLLTSLEAKFSSCIIYDLNSPLSGNTVSATGLFQIGTHYIDKDRYQAVLNHLRQRLLKTQLTNISNSVSFDDGDFGKGYQASFINKNHPDSLCIPLSIKKLYMDEQTGEPYPLIIDEFTQNLKQAISYNASYFTRKFSRQTIRRALFFAEESNRVIKNIDAALYRAGKGIDTLRYINPLNLARERKRFFAKECNYTPQFYYRQLKIDPFVFRKRLYAIPVDNIQDVSIRHFYRSTIDMLAEKIDLLTTIGTEKFLYNSLRFHGEPREQDIKLAQFLITAPSIDEKKEDQLGANDCAEYFRRARADYGFDYRVELTNRIVARAMVNNARRTVLINKDSMFTKTEILALIHHELGVHMVTGINARKQALKIFKLGLPGNTETQEGLAIISEYLSGNLTLCRLKTLAHRLMAVHMMVQNYDFSRTFKALNDDFGLSKEDAFSLTARVYRGGGFTKDYLYLTGLRQGLRMFLSGINMQPLFVGKTSFAYLPILKEMIDREIIVGPAHMPQAWSATVENNSILGYLLKSIAS